MRDQRLKLRKLAAYRFLPALVSVIALVAILSYADLDAFRGLASRVQWSLLPVLLVLLPAIVVAFGLRWRTLLHESLPRKRSIVISALGLGGNQVLPLRGGDALRVVLSARGVDAPSMHAGVSALAMEKMFDLLAVAALGLAATASLVNAGTEDGRVNVLVAAAAILVTVAVALFAARSGLLIDVFRKLARLVRMPIRVYRHMFRPLDHLRRSVTPVRIGLLLVETGLIWIALYLPTYLVIAHLVRVPLNIADAMMLLFAGALGVAIPAAPSAVGTLHAAIVSAFVLLGRPASEGLVLAVAIHGVFFVGLCAAGAIAMVAASRELGPLRVSEGRV